MDKIRKDFLGERQEVIDKCQGCENLDGDFCNCYLYPQAMWRKGNPCIRFCDPNIAIEEKKKKFVNPLKYSKRGW